MLRRLEIAAGVLDDGDDVAFDSIDYKMYQKGKRAADVDVAPEPRFSIAQSLDSAVQESARLATESRVPPYVSTTKHSHSYTRMREPESAGMGGFMQFEYLTAGVYTFESHSAVYADPSSQDKVSVELKTPRQVVGGAEIPFPGADNTILTSKTITKDGPVHKTLIAGFTLTDLPAATYTIPYYSQQIVGSMERQTQIQTQEPKKLSSDRYSSLLDVAPVKRAATSASDNESGAKDSLEAGAKASLESGAKAKASSNFESGAKASLSSTVSSESCGNVIFTDQLNEEEKAVRPIAFSATATAAGSSRDTAKDTSNYTQSPGAMRRDTRRADANLVSSAPPPPRASLPKAMQDAMQDASTSVSLPEVAPAILQPGLHSMFSRVSSHLYHLDPVQGQICVLCIVALSTCSKLPQKRFAFAVLAVNLRVTHALFFRATTRSRTGSQHARSRLCAATLRLCSFLDSAFACACACACACDCARSICACSC